MPVDTVTGAVLMLAARDLHHGGLGMLAGSDLIMTGLAATLAASPLRLATGPAELEVSRHRHEPCPAQHGPVVAALPVGIDLTSREEVTGRLSVQHQAAAWIPAPRNPPPPSPGTTGTGGRYGARWPRSPS